MPTRPHRSKITKETVACVLPFETRDLPISKERAAGVSETQLKEVTQHADGKGIYYQPSSPWRNSVHSNDAADNGDSDNFVVVMVVESKNEVFSIPESLETIG